MKTIVDGLRTGRTGRWALVASVLVGGAASLGFMNTRQYQLGGGWVFSAPGVVYSALQIPLDPAGRTAVLRVNAITFDPGTAGLLAAMGADTLVGATGQAKMISGDTATWRMVEYGNKQGFPPQIREFLVTVGTLKFTGPNEVVISYTLDAYAADADADGDGLPDPGAVPFMSIPGLTATGRRVLAP